MFAGLRFAGHNGAISDVNFSHDKNMLISSSSDGTAAIWNISRVEAPVVLFSHTIHHARPMGGSDLKTCSDKTIKASSSSRNRPYGGDIVSSHFFYQDRFAVLVIISVKIISGQFPCSFLIC